MYFHQSMINNNDDINNSNNNNNNNNINVVIIVIKYKCIAQIFSSLCSIWLNVICTYGKQ